jgi:nucleotide-binding universal stress UspA family protein
MFPIRTILHPTDFSDRSEAALQVAHCLAREHGARLIILHVAPEEVVGGGLPIVPMDPRFYRDSLNEVRIQAEGPDLKFPVETLLRHGDTAEEILGAAERLGCDLIVMGSHGRTGFARLLMGSVAEAVLRRAPCPVLTVKAPFPTPSPVMSEPIAEPTRV